MKIEKIVTFNLPNDAVAAVELKVKLEKDNFYVYDEGKDDWVLIDVSMFVKEDLMTVKGVPKPSLG